MGVGALYYLELALRELPGERTRLLAAIRPAVLMVIMGSVVVHGVTIPLFSLHVKLRKSYTKRKGLLPWTLEEGNLNADDRTPPKQVEEPNDASAASSSTQFNRSDSAEVQNPSAEGKAGLAPVAQPEKAHTAADQVQGS